MLPLSNILDICIVKGCAAIVYSQLFLIFITYAILYEHLQIIIENTFFHLLLSFWGWIFAASANGYDYGAGIGRQQRQL